MPNVLLITEQPRVRQLFSKMERDGMFRLRIAPTLAQSGEEISARLPHYVFVESGISELPGATIARYLRDLLPEGSEVILITADRAAAVEMRELGDLFQLDLSENDDILQRQVRDILPKNAALEKPASPEPPPSPPKTARELIFDEPHREGPSWDRRLLWLIPLAMLATCLGVIARQSWKQAPSAAPPDAVSNTATQVGKATAPIRMAAAPAGQRAAYTVRPGDNLLKILVKDFGFSYQDAVAKLPEFRHLNHLSNADTLKPGQTLTIPDGGKSGSQAR